MFLTKLLGQVRCFIIIVYNNSLFFALLYVDVNIKQGNFQIIFTYFIFRDFWYIFFLWFKFLIALVDCLLFFCVINVLFIFTCILLHCKSHFKWIFHKACLYFLMSIPSFLYDVLSLLPYFSGLFHSYKYFISIFNLHYLLLAS